MNALLPTNYDILQEETEPDEEDLHNLIANAACERTPPSN